MPQRQQYSTSDQYYQQAPLPIILLILLSGNVSYDIVPRDSQLGQLVSLNSIDATMQLQTMLYQNAPQYGIKQTCLTTAIIKAIKKGISS